jgi:Zn finger protein HypA/HybF involved in hydrogenase expression
VAAHLRIGPCRCLRLSHLAAAWARDLAGHILGRIRCPFLRNRRTIKCDLGHCIPWNAKEVEESLLARLRLIYCPTCGTKMTFTTARITAADAVRLPRR